MKSQNKNQLRSLIFGGLIPVIGYTIVEEYFGIIWGLFAGIGFSIAEILIELKFSKKIDLLTWVGTSFVVGLGLIALLTRDGVWFKLQPAIMEFLVGALLFSSYILKKPFLLIIAKKQNLFLSMTTHTKELVEHSFSSLTLRISLFFFIHTVLAFWAALSWSTRMWALLKGVGFTISLILYLLIEALILRKKIQKNFYSYERFKKVPSLK